MALGAQRGNVHGLILREASKLTAGGLACGLFGPLAAAALMSTMPFGVRSWDVTTLVAIAVVRGFAGLTVSYIPASRAASANRVYALRSSDWVAFTNTHAIQCTPASSP